MITVFVPRPGARLGILPGSAIVSEERAGDPIFYFEGNAFGAVNGRRWADRVALAAGRIGAPTRARGSYPAEDLIPVGYWDGVQGRVTLLPGGEEPLTEWLGGEPLALQASGYRFERERALLDPSLGPLTRRYLERTLLR